ncbi:NAD-dependent epimerase/dehydratase family protein [Filimonas effusa]|uniref:NAD(P)-dependent oxidoreductase n=1 Tax=Filimonas effusa TaxID=2508721 RepID=A0A4Q1D419_9BACT|nr:NAD(P)-dependent oxidoreductase [Filimonas effusa]RXK83165.1 NAD(P)-dependent oxidoreductase [Filimonas effusa]
MSIQLGKILITGATGLVGARLVPRLQKMGWECVALVRKGKNVPSGITMMEGDLFDTPTLAQAVKGVSAIIHLAAVFRTQDTDLIWKSNLEGTHNLIMAAKEHNPGVRFIFASTNHVYNINNSHPGCEEDVVEPQHPYPASKVEAEKELRVSELNWSILRFPFVYGDADGHLESLQGHAIAGKMHPAMKISTIHHLDIATAMNVVLAGAMDRRIVNITDEATLSVYELIQIAGGKMEPSAEPLQNPWHLHADGSLARSLGFQPMIRTVYQAAQENLL